MSKEAQEEFDALLSIYSSDIKVISSIPICYEVTVKDSFLDSDPNDVDAHPTKYITLRIETPLNYPSTENLRFEIIQSNFLRDDDSKNLKDLLDSKVKQSIGFLVAFELTILVQDFMANYLSPEQIESAAINEGNWIDKIPLRDVGTPVNAEVFQKWLQTFEEEIKSSNYDNFGDSQIVKLSTLTGKEYFAKLKERRAKGITGEYPDEEEDFGTDFDEMNIDESLYIH